MDKRRVTRTPSLPPELWLCIFHHATHVPGTLVPDIYGNTIILGPIFIKKYHPAIREALLTKRALVRVCKEWWHLAVPILYRSVYVGRARCLYSLSNTLARSAEGKGTVISMRPLGDYTQRLDIVIRDHAKDANAECKLLTDIIACMPHLAISLIAATTSFTDSDLSEQIMGALHSCTASLSVLDWSSAHLESFPSPVVDLLANCTQLRVLNYPCLLEHWQLKRVIPSTVTTLCLRYYNTPTSTASFAKLKALPISAPSALRELFLPFGTAIPLWNPLLRLYGPQLISVQLYLPNDALIDVYSHLSLIARACPSLRRLTITLSNFWNIAEHHPMSLPIPVTYLGLIFEHAKSHKLSFFAPFTFLEHMRPSMPSLRVVRFLNEANVEYLLKKHAKIAVRALRPFMGPNGVPFRIKDQDGVLLTDRLKALGYL